MDPDDQPDDRYDEYVLQTAQLSLFRTDLDYFAAFHRYMLALLLCVRDAWPAPGEKWFQIAKACAEDAVTADAVNSCRMETLAYWQASSEKPFGQVRSQQEAAIVLFHRALEHREDSAWMTRANASSIARSIDFAAEVFIRSFGRPDDVVQMLRDAFQAGAPR